MLTKPASNFSSSFAEKLPYLPTLARYIYPDQETTPLLTYGMSCTGDYRWCRRGPVHTGMGLKGQTNWEGCPSVLHRKL